MNRSLLGLSMIACLFLSACGHSKLSFSEIEVVPENLKDHFEVEHRIQLVGSEEGLYTSYIIQRAAGEVTTDLETDGDTVIIKLDEEYTQEEPARFHVYKLTTEPEHTVIKVQIDGKQVPFDHITNF